MTIKYNETKTKAVKLVTEFTGIVRAIHVQIYNGEESVIEFKSYNSMKSAEKYAQKVLN
jgi:uncharacterized protein YpmB